MAELNPVTLILIFMAIFSFLIFLLVYGESQGGQWQIIAQGVAKFSLLLIVFAAAIIAIVHVARRK